MRMTVGDLMTKNLVRVSTRCSADDALDILSRHEATELYVTDSLGRLLGVLPDYEIIKVQLRGCAVSISEIGALLYQACDRKEGRTHGCGRGSSVWVCGLPRR